MIQTCSTRPAYGIIDVARIRQASGSSPEPQVFLRSSVWKTTFHLQTCANERLLPMVLGLVAFLLFLAWCMVADGSETSVVRSESV